MQCRAGGWGGGVDNSGEGTENPEGGVEGGTTWGELWRWMDKFGKRGEYGVSSGGIWAGQHGASSGSIWRDKFGKRGEYGEEYGVSSGGGDLRMEGYREAPADVCGVKRGIGKREGESERGADAPVWGSSGFLIRTEF